MGDNLPLRAAADEASTPALFAAFRKFRNNVDLMTTRVGAWHLNLAFGHVLARVESYPRHRPTTRRCCPCIA